MNTRRLSVISVLMFLALSTLSVHAQQNERPYSRIDLRPGIGYNIGSNHTSTGVASDYLIDHDLNSFYWQIFAGSFYITQHFGLEVTMQGSNINNYMEQSSDYENFLNKKYGDEYFISTDTRTPDYRGFLFVGDQQSFRAGPILRYQKGKFMYKVKLLLGSEFIYAKPSTITLKEKGTNQVIEINYSASEQFQEIYSIAPAASLGYRLGGRFILNLDLYYSYCKTNFTYKETIVNLDSRDEKVNLYPYKYEIHKLSLGLGLTIEFGKIIPRTKKSPSAP